MKLPVINDPVQTQIEGIKVFASLYYFHHCFIVQFCDVT